MTLLSQPQTHKPSSLERVTNYTINKLCICPGGWDPRWWERTERCGGTSVSARDRRRRGLAAAAPE